MTEHEVNPVRSEKKDVIFCDFDGTITENDNIIAIIRHFNPPGWEPIVNDIVSQRKTIRQGVGRAVSHASSFIETGSY